MKSDFLKDLNEQQRQAVEYNDGASLVIAGAGSGKTRVLTYKIAYLLQQGMAPWNILALTFTNKAADEMKERIAALVGEDKARSLWMGTFHSIFNRILRYEAHLLGFTQRYTIYKPDDTKSLVKNLLKEMQLDDKEYKPGVVCGRISEAKNAMVLPDDYAANAETRQRDRMDHMEQLGLIYKFYVERMKRANAMDFDDLLLNTYLLFEHHPEVLEKYAQRFHFILVDEYQDTNTVQHRIMHQLARRHEHICVVGDDAQSIYSFRGAQIDNILEFAKVYRGAKLFKLEQNYRSTQNIVKAANSLIACNKRQIEKEVFSRNEEGDPLQLNVAFSDVEEGEIVCNRISRLHRTEGTAYSQMAILYRTNAQSRIFEEGLLKRSIPYRIYAGHSFYDHAEIRDVLSYFRLIVNNRDEEAFKRCIKCPRRGIGDTTIEKVILTAHRADAGVWDVMENPDQYSLDVNRGTRNKLEAFREMMHAFISSQNTLDAYELASDIISKSGIGQDYLQKNDAESIDKQNNLSELLNAINTFVETQKETDNEQRCHLADFLSEVALFSDQDEQAADDADREAVTLMTVHSAKGLEFDNVFIVGMEENLFPSAQSLYSQRAMEEERRLFYVAITRARKRCYLSASKSRFMYGKMEICDPSPFLREIDRHYLRLDEGKKASPASPGGLRLHHSPSPATPAGTARLRPMERNALPVEDRKYQEVKFNGTLLRLNDRVEHERFGRGTVETLEGEPDNIKATIDFENSGTKRLLLKYAKIKIIH